MHSLHLRSNLRLGQELRASACADLLTEVWYSGLLEAVQVLLQHSFPLPKEASKFFES